MDAAGSLYNGLAAYYRSRFGMPVRKLSLDAACGCPNRDGRLDTTGCIFCDPESFSPSRRSRLASVSDQLAHGIARLRARYGATKFIAYFQPGSNTYGPIDRLRRAYREAAAHPDVIGLALGTRPDCVGEEILDLLAETAAQKWLVVEYGLQSVHDRTLGRLNRGHHYDDFLDAYQRTRRRGIDICVHIILGLPGESPDDMRATARALADLQLHSLKLHNLFAVRNTVLADDVAAGRITLPALDEYAGWAADFLELTPENVVIERLSGDAPPEYLLGPQWCADRAAVRRAIESELRRRGTRQGCNAP